MLLFITLPISAQSQKTIEIARQKYKPKPKVQVAPEVASINSLIAREQNLEKEIKSLEEILVVMKEDQIKLRQELNELLEKEIKLQEEKTDLKIEELKKQKEELNKKWENKNNK